MMEDDTLSDAAFHPKELATSDVMTVSKGEPMSGHGCTF